MSTAAPLVLVHGCGTDSSFWDELRPHLTGTVLAPSLPGRADTPGPPCTSAEQAGRWLVERLAADGISGAIVVGHSFGGGIAIEAVLHDPTRFAGLVLVSSGARLRVAPAILAAVDEAVRTGIPADLVSWAFHPDTDPALVARVEARARLIPVETTRADWTATNDFDRIGALALPVPTLAIAGTDDRLTPPKYAHWIAEHVPGTTVELVDGAGHMLPIERPAALASALLRFRDGI